jgi:uncharacterized protein (TIGR02453 family)
MKKIVVTFLDQLAKNNNREWFQEHKEMYEEAKTEFESVVNTMIPAISKFDDSVKFLTAKDCMFRFYRDVRFSKDKSPYKTNFGAFMTKGGKKSHGPGYYFHVQSGECFLSGGIWEPEPEITKKIRKEIYYNIKEFKDILSDKSFRKYYSGIDDWDKLKTAPKDFPADFPDMDLLKNRSFTTSHALSDKILFSEEIVDYAVKAFKAMYPYNQFLRRAVEG